MKFDAKLLLVPAILALANCNQTEPSRPESTHDAASGKPPLVFDESSILTPPAEITGSPSSPKGLQKAAAGQYYTFGIGNGLTSADLNQACRPDAPGFSYCNLPKYVVGNTAYNLFPSAGGLYFQATYSARLAANPENMWVANGYWLQANQMLDNEQAEIHYYATNASPYSGTGPSDWSIEVEYEINTELNYDYLWINGTTAGAGCNSPGSVHKKVSGTASGTVIVVVPYSANCSSIWLGIYYIKDYSVTAPGEYVRVRRAKVSTTGVVGH